MPERPAVPDWITATERFLQRVEVALLTTAILAMTSLGFIQIVLRKGFSSGLLWADPLMRWLVLWMGFLGAAVAAAQDKHFGADAADRLLSGRTRIAAQVVSHLFAAGACALLGRAAIVFLRSEFGSPGTAFSIGSLHVPTTWVELILPAGFFLLLTHFLLRATAAALELRK